MFGFLFGEDPYEKAMNEIRKKRSDESAETKKKIQEKLDSICSDCEKKRYEDERKQFELYPYKCCGRKMLLTGSFAVCQNCGETQILKKQKGKKLK